MEATNSQPGTPKTVVENPTEKFQRLSKVHSIIFELQKIGTDDLAVPEIVVVGPQSAGKSTLLRRIIGLDIIPVKPKKMSKVQWTKNPIKVLITPADTFTITVSNHGKPPKTKSFTDPSSQVEELKSVQFKNFFFKNYDIDNVDALKNEKLKETETIIQISRPEVIPLCFIDIPGHVTFPKEDRDVVENLMKKYFENENTIILLAHPANEDIQSTNLVFTMMRENKQCFDRTIGVLTKCDMVDQAEVASTFKQLFSQENFSPKLGWIALKNPKDEKNVDFSSQLKEEQLFFSQQHFEGVMEPERCGLENLIKYSSTILATFVEKWRPAAMKKLEIRKETLIQTKKMLGEPVNRNLRDCNKLIDACIKEISDNAFQTNEHGSNRIKLKYEEFTKKIRHTSALFDHNEIEKSSKTDAGIYSLKVETVDQFKRSLEKTLPRIKELSTDLVNEVFDISKDIIIKVIHNMTSNFHDLGTELIKVFRKYLEDQKDALNCHIQVFIQSYLGFYNPELNDVEEIKKKIEILEKEIRQSVALTVPNIISSYSLFQV